MKGIINWFIDNPIAANLMMVMILVGGLTGLDKIEKEVQPNFVLNQVTITVPYPGAGPKEIAQLICLRIEEAVENLQGIKELTCIAQNSVGIARIEATPDYPILKLLNEVKSRVDAIATLPADSERPIIEQRQFRVQVLNIAVVGNESSDEKSLKEFSTKLKNEMLLRPNIPEVIIQGVRSYEMSIEIDEHKLRKYGLSIGQVANAIRGTSINLGGGIIRAAAGEIQVQARNQALYKEDFEKIPLIALPTGGTLNLGDLATIRDGFVDVPVITRIDKLPATLLTVYMNEKPDVLKVSKAVKDYVKEVSHTLPDGYKLKIWQDSSQYFHSRLDTLIRSGSSGLILVFIILLLFLRPALAVWVSVGIAVSFIGALLLLSIVNTSINIITLFAFIMVLGIVVDDAIIIGESIYSQQQRGIFGGRGAKIGANLMAKPVFFAVTTSILVFVPLLMLSGEWAYFMGPIATIPILVLLFSLLESCFILPAHLTHLRPESKKPWVPKFRQLRNAIDRGMRKWLILYYQPFLRKCLYNRSTTIASFLGFCVISISLVAGGWVKVALPPDVTFDFIQINIDFPEGVAERVIKEATDHIESTAYKASESLTRENEKPVLDSIFVYGSGNSIFTLIELIPEAERHISTTEYSKYFQKLLGSIPQAEKIRTIDKVAFEDADVTLRLYATDADELDEATTWLKKEMLSITGFYNINDNILAGRPELDLKIKPNASNLGFQVSDIARQVRQFFYGEEAQRIPRGNEDIRVMVRYPKYIRDDINSLEELRLRSPSGEQIPLQAVTQLTFQEGYAKIIRVNGRASIDINADYENPNVSLAQAVQKIERDVLPKLYALYPTISADMKGEQEGIGSFVNDLIRLGTLAILVIYGLLSIQFRSIYQPLVIITAIPISLTGVIWPHLISGSNISLMSVLGMLAAAGVIVNDTIVLLDNINRKRKLGLSINYAMLRAARGRFRPIFLTTLTTFFGLIPIMLETSLQAKFLIPMAMALAYGILSASIVTLVLIPCIYTLGLQFKLGLVPFYKRHIQLGLQGQQKLSISLLSYAPFYILSSLVLAGLATAASKIVFGFVGMHSVHSEYFTQVIQFACIAMGLGLWSTAIWRCSANTIKKSAIWLLSARAIAILTVVIILLGFLKIISAL